jgi:sugar lactone lactonase YvrE
MKHTLLFTFLLFSFAAHAQIITTVAGFDSVGYNGDNILAIDAKLDAPVGVAIDGAGNFYIADTYNNRIRKVDTAGVITTIAGNNSSGYNGDGIPATAAEIYRPAGIICDHLGNICFVDAFNNRVRKIDAAGIITTIAGNGIAGYNGDNISADTAQVNDPHYVAIDNNGNIYISDFTNHRIRKINTTGTITTIAGTGVAGYNGDHGPATAAEINGPYGIALDDTGNIYFADALANVVRKIDTSGTITTFAGTGSTIYNGDNQRADSATLDNPIGIAIDVTNNIYVSDAYHTRIRKISSTSGIITTIAGDGTGGFSGDNGLATNAEINVPASIAISIDGSLYFADFNNSRIRRVGWPLNITQLPAHADNTIIYPNPVITMLNIQSASPVSQVSIANILGQIVYSQLLASNAQSVKIDVSELPAGFYFIKINESEIRKVIKE